MGILLFVFMFCIMPFLFYLVAGFIRFKMENKQENNINKEKNNMSKKTYKPLEDRHFKYIEMRTGRKDRENIEKEYKRLFDYLISTGNPDPESGDYGIPCFSIFILQNEGCMLSTDIMIDFDKEEGEN